MPIVKNPGTKLIASYYNMFSFKLKNLNLRYNWLDYLFFASVIFGVWVRVWKFNELPSPLNQDEVSAGYEAWSLLTTGKDRWGNLLPVYFPSWGSGQNVLYSYITTVSFWLFGVSSWSLRLPNLLFGLGCIPLAYFLGYSLTKSKSTGKILAILFAINPWLIITSRWAMDVNFLPFMVLLSLYFIFHGLELQSSKWQKLVSLIPLGLLFYVYGTTVFVLPVFLSLVILTDLPQIRQNLITYVSSFLIFVVLAIPFGMFIYKNQFLKHDLGFEAYLPFSVPLLPTSRVEITDQTIGEALENNYHFLFKGFNDGFIWNAAAVQNPHGLIVLFFGIFGLVWLFGLLLEGLVKIKPAHSSDINNEEKSKDTWQLWMSNIIYFLWKRNTILDKRLLILLWVVACLPLARLVNLNLSRSNLFQTGFLIAAGLLIGYLYETFAKLNWSKLPKESIFIFKQLVTTFATTVILVLSVESFYFQRYLFGEKSQSNLAIQSYFEDQKNAFNYGFDDTVKAAQNNSSSSEKILVTDKIIFNYLQVSFNAQIQPSIFQKSNWKQVTGSGEEAFEVDQIGNFYFKNAFNPKIEDEVRKDNTYLVIAHKSEWVGCSSSLQLFEKGDFLLFRCKP